MKIKHVFFDLDHTLWDFETNSKAAYRACFKEMDIQVGFEDFIGVYVDINEAYWKLYREEKVTKETLKYGRLKDSFDILSYSISDEMINELAESYLYQLPKYNALFEGSIEILEYLSEKYQLHIITNGFSEIQNIKLSNAKIQRYFKQIITSESAGFKKPNPKVFYFAMDKANAKPEESIMIGDSFEADILGALQVGMQAIYFNPNKNEKQHEALNEIIKLHEIKKYL